MPSRDKPPGKAIPEVEEERNVVPLVGEALNFHKTGKHLKVKVYLYTLCIRHSFLW